VFTAGQPKAAAGVRDIAIPPHIRGIIKAHLKNHVGGGSGALPFTDDDGSQLRPPVPTALGESPQIQPAVHARYAMNVPFTQQSDCARHGLTATTYPTTCI
jgi:hypothetical protein